MNYGNYAVIAASFGPSTDFTEPSTCWEEDVMAKAERTSCFQRGSDEPSQREAHLLFGEIVIIPRRSGTAAGRTRRPHS